MRKLALLVLALALVTLVNAQQRTGDIYGKVTDPEGAPLPGVTVVLTGSVVGKIEAVSNEQGIFRFKSLAPANDYEVTAELEGFKKGIRRQITVLLGGSTEVNFQMQLGVMTEEVIVLASAPVVNTKSTQVATVVTRTELQSLPTGRDPFIILAMAPGVQTDRENLAGSESGQQASSVGRGLNTYDNNIWNVDGINVTDPAAIGATPTYWDFDAFEEMNVTVGGADVAIQTGGIALNMVTRRGGNRHSLGGRFYVTDSAFQDENLTDALKAKGVAGVNKIRAIKDFGFNLGGPVIKNKMFYWLSYGVQDLKTKTLLGDNDDTLLTNYAFKINIQPIEANRFEAFLHAGGKTKEGRSITPQQPKGLGQGGQRHFGSPIIKLQDEHTFGNNLFLSLKWAFSDAGFKLWSMIDPNNLHVGVYSQALDLYTGHYSYYDVKRPKTNYAGNLTYFNDKILGGSHEMMVGFEYTKFSQEVTSTMAGNMQVNIDLVNPYLDFNGDGVDEVPGASWGIINSWRPYYRLQYVDQTSAYFQDNMTYGRLMFKLGLRYDRYVPQLKATQFDGMPIEEPAVQEAIASNTLDKLDKLFPAAEAAAVKPSEHVVTIFSPRLGVTWDINGNGKTILKLSLARYGDVMGTGLCDMFSPFGTGGWMDFYWNDVNGDKKASFDELYWYKYNANGGRSPYKIYDASGNFTGDYATAYQECFGGYDYTQPTTTFPSKTVVDGQRQSSYTNEALITLERELSRDLAVAVNATYRKFTDFRWTPGYYGGDITNNLGNPSWYTAVGTIPASFTTTKWGTVSTGEAAGRTYYMLGTAYKNTDTYVNTDRKGYSQDFWSVDLILTKRLSKKWMAQSSFTYQDQWTKYDTAGQQGYQNPTNIWAYDGAPYAPYIGGASGKTSQYVFSRWMFKLTGLYQLPWDINVSAVVTGHEGNIINRYFTLRNDKSPNALSRTITVDIESFGETRLPTLWDVTLRAEKMIKVGENQIVYLMFDLFNAFNWSTEDRTQQLSYGTWNVTTSKWTNSAPNAGKLENILNPRVFRLGVRFQF